MKNFYLIWDLPVRLFHWFLVVTFCGLWLTAELGSDYMQYHTYCGYFMLFLLTFRILWGVVGTTHSKFISFAPTPNRIKTYLKPSTDQPDKIPGHNPFGALMVFVMLVLLLIQAISGLFISDDVFTAGPYSGSVASDLEKLFGRLHDLCFTLLQICIGLHLVAIGFYKIAKKMNLVKPMITGKKSEDEVNSEQQIPHSKLLTAFCVALASAVFIYWLVVLNAPVIEDYYYY